jgi:wobble nucleotide-excising tRNase
MIDSIDIKKIASYDETGISIQNLKKINFIYGSNGTGKTTITNVVDTPDNDKFTNCSVSWFQNQPLKALVYNKDFKESNFGKGKLNGVFTLGSATKEEREAIEAKQVELNIIKEAGKSLRKNEEALSKTIESTKTSFTESVWTNMYKKNQENFKEAFEGSIGSKKAFMVKVFKENITNTAALETKEEILKKVQTVFGKQPTQINQITNIGFVDIISIENKPIWEKIVVGKTDVEIAPLIQRLNNTDWVNQGRKYIHEDDETCPFCQEKTIDENFREQLEQFFDENFTNDINSIKEKKAEYFHQVENLVNLLDEIERSQKAKEDTKLDLEKFSSLLKTLEAQVNLNKKSIDDKIKEPSRPISVTSLENQLIAISEEINKANMLIQDHNKVVLNFQSEKNKLIAIIWRFVLEEYKTETTIYLKKSGGLQKSYDLNDEALKLKLEEHAHLVEEINELTENVTSIVPTINEINKLLKSYGFLNFQIVEYIEEEGFYQIHREDGTIAEDTLSEGEITFITFLYYLQLAKGGIEKEGITEDRILIIDDPVSSLDSNILFVVSTLIKEIIEEIKKERGNIKQLILLTHNVYFHKEVSFIDGRTSKLNNTNFWILRKNRKVTSIQSYDMDNPIKSSYELMWKELKNSEHNSGITVQNIMRLIIENYFKLLGKYGDDDLIGKFESAEEQKICKSLISWINDGSHSINDDLFVEVQDHIIEKYKEVFKQIFILTKHEEHYNMMMKETETEAA